MNQFIDSPQQSPMAYQPYMPFQGSNNMFLNMALQYLVPGTNPGYNGSIMSPYNSFAEAASAKKESDRFMDAVNSRSEAERRIQMSLADSGMRYLMERSGQVYTQQHQDGIQTAMGIVDQAASTFGQYGEWNRKFNDIAAGGADPRNSRLAFEMSHKRMRDVTGGDRLSRESADTMGLYLHDELFGDQAMAGRGRANFHAYELPEMLRELANRGQLNTGQQGDFFAANKKALDDMANGRLSRSAEAALRARASGEGVEERFMDELKKDPTMLGDSARMDELARRSTAAKIGNVTRDFDNLRNAVKSLVDPNNQKSITEAFKSFEMFSAAYGSQFTHKDQARIVREATSSLKEMGLGYDAFAAMTERGHSIAQQMGFQGGAEMVMMPGITAAMSAASKMGQFSGDQGYGAVSRSERTDREFASRLEAAKSENMKFLHGMLSVGVEAFDENTAEGREAIELIKEMQETGNFSNEKLMNMTMAQKKSFARRGMKDSATMGVLAANMADSKGVESTAMTTLKGAADHIRDMQPQEMLKMVGRDSNRLLAATEVGKNLRSMGLDAGKLITDAMKSGKISAAAGNDPTKFKEEMTSAQMEMLSPDQIAAMGGEDAARAMLMQMNSAAAPAMNSLRQANANKNTLLSEFDPKRKAAVIQAEARASIDAMVNTNTEGILNRDGFDVAAKGVREFVRQIQSGEKKPGEIDFEGIMQTALSTAGGKDKESLEELQNAFKKMDEQMLKDQAFLDSGKGTDDQKARARANIEAYNQKKKDTLYNMVGEQTDEQKAEAERLKKEAAEEAKNPKTAQTGSGIPGTGATGGQVTLTGQPIFNHLEIHVPNGTFTMNDAKAGPAIQRA